MPEMQALHHWLEQGWYAHTARWPLRPLAALYGLIVVARRWMYRSGLRRSAHAGVPTVVVGNLTVGGTGKTPLVIWLAGRLRQAGRRPGIVLRGHGGRQRAPMLVGPDADPRRVGDEAVLHARRARCPVAVGAARAEAARLLVQAGCDCVIADDGLQHLALRRDLEIIVIDGTRGFGNGALLPAGPLRERRSLAHTDALIVVHGDDRHRVVPEGAGHFEMRLEAGLPRHLASDEAASPLSLHGATVHAVAGVGNPQRFFELLRGLGTRPIEHPLPDHHRFVPADLAGGGGHPIVMTEKDAVKCRALAGGRNDLFYLPVEAVLPEADAARLLDRVLAIGRV
jgi:tetraacyldisaccharide 4'-kinase